MASVIARSSPGSKAVQLVMLVMLSWPCCRSSVRWRASGQTLAAGLYRATQGLGIGEQKVARSHNVHELLEREL